MIRSIILLTTFFGLFATSYAIERQVTAVWDATGDTLELDSVRYTTVSSVSSKQPVDYLNGNTLFNPTANPVNYSVYSYDGRNVSQGRLTPHAQHNLNLDKGVFFIQVDGRVHKWQKNNKSGQVSARFLSSQDDSVAIAYKTGYKNKPIIIGSNQSELLFEMERDSTIGWHNVAGIETIVMLGDSYVIKSEYQYYDQPNSDTVIVEDYNKHFHHHMDPYSLKDDPYATVYAEISDTRVALGGSKRNTHYTNYVIFYRNEEYISNFTFYFSFRTGDSHKYRSYINESLSVEKMDLLEVTDSSFIYEGKYYDFGTGFKYSYYDFGTLFGIHKVEEYYHPLLSKPIVVSTIIHNK